MLGERQVNGRVDRDRIEVGRYEGTYSKLTVYVLDSELEMVDMKIKFSDNTEYHPDLKYVFREGSRTRVLDLPPAEHIIKFIDFIYKNVPGDGRRAKVQVWGWKTGNAVPPPVAPVWDQRGWTRLGDRTVNGSYDHDRIEVGAYQGTFKKLTVWVEDSDLEMIDFAVKFGNGEVWHPTVSHFFREGTRTRVIDLPGDQRIIKFIDFKYRNLPGGGRARVSVWGGGGEIGPVAPEWDSKGWRMLGERQINGAVDTDKIEVGRYEGSFAKLMLVVTEGDLEMIDFAIKFEHGPPFHPELRAFFKEGSRTRAIDLPGDRRMIKWIEFKYAKMVVDNRRRTPNPHVQVWAK